jgi:DNA-binding beta-propeller fold protein YncE
MTGRDRIATATALDSPQLYVTVDSRRYSVKRPWGAVPQAAGIVTDVAVADDGHVFVLTRRDSIADVKRPSIIELNPAGGFVASWGEDELADAHMIRCGPDGRLYVVDRDAHQIVIFDRLGGVAGRIGARHDPGNPFNHPSGVAIGADGDIFVADGYGGTFVHRFSAEGKPLCVWGSRGAAPGQFVTPHAICALKTGAVIVADRENNRLQLFDGFGGLLAVWAGFYRPTGIWVDRNDKIYVTDQVPSLTVIDSGGNFLGRCRPVLNGAHGICGDEDRGFIYLAETNPSRVTRLESCSSDTSEIQRSAIGG